MFLVIFISESFSVVVRVDKVEVNVRVAASRLHVRPDDIFLGVTKIKSTWTQLQFTWTWTWTWTRCDKNKINLDSTHLGFAEESESPTHETLHVLQHSSVHNLRMKVTENLSFFQNNVFIKSIQISFTSLPNNNNNNNSNNNNRFRYHSPLCPPGTGGSSSSPLEADVESSSEPAEMIKNVLYKELSFSHLCSVTI